MSANQVWLQWLIALGWGDVESDRLLAVIASATLEETTRELRYVVKTRFPEVVA